jgi:hypothetical protein
VLSFFTRHDLAASWMVCVGFREAQNAHLRARSRKLRRVISGNASWQSGHLWQLWQRVFNNLQTYLANPRSESYLRSQILFNELDSFLPHF